jgi:hypothetical protein
MDKSIKILVSIKDIKSEAKRIKKENKENTIPHTKILDILIRNLGYLHYNEYEHHLKNSDNSLNIKSISKINFNELLHFKSSIIDDFKEFDINIKNIHFIDKRLSYLMNEMLIYKPYSMSVYLTLLPNLLSLGKNNIINIKTWDIDKYNFKFCINKLIKKYSQTIDFSEFENTTFNNEHFNGYFNFFEIYKFSKENKAIENISDNSIKTFCNNLKNNGFREFSIAINNLKYALYDIEGLFFSKLNDLNDKKITIDELYNFSKLIIKKERDFLMSYSIPWHSELSDIEYNQPITIPEFKDNHLGKNNRLIANIKNETNPDNPVCVGFHNKKTLFSYDTNYLTLTKTEYMKNILISGSVGSGKTVIGMSFLFQSLINNKGAIYIDEYDNQSYFMISSLAKEFNREKDILFFNANQSDYILKSNFEQLLHQNKIVIISLPYLDSLKMKDEYSAIVNHIFKQIKNSKKSKQHYFPNSIFINNFESLCDDDIKTLFDLIPIANKKNINFIVISQSFYNNSFHNNVYSDLMKLFSNTLVMKQEYPLIANYMKNLKTINSRNFRSLNAGQFYFAKDGILDNKIIYTGLYAYSYDQKHITINYPYFKI